MSATGCAALVVNSRQARLGGAQRIVTHKSCSVTAATSDRPRALRSVVDAMVCVGRKRGANAPAGRVSHRTNRDDMDLRRLACRCSCAVASCEVQDFVHSVECRHFIAMVISQMSNRCASQQFCSILRKNGIAMQFSKHARTKTMMQAMHACCCHVLVLTATSDTRHLTSTQYSRSL